MSAALNFLIRKEVRDRYPNAYAWGGELAGMGASLAIYWFTARAFAPSMASGLAEGTSYFDYLLIGETALFLPLCLFQGVARQLRQAAQLGTLDAMLAQPVAPWKIASLLGLAAAPLELARALLTLAVAWAFFGFKLGLPGLAAAFTLQLLAAPAFLGLGLIGSAALVRFGRGETALTYLGAGATVLAGAYFPVDVLPPALARLASGAASPFSILLRATRELLAGAEPAVFFMAAGSLVLWGALALGLGIRLVGASFESSRRSARPFYFPSM